MAALFSFIMCACELIRAVFSGCPQSFQGGGAGKVVIGEEELEDSRRKVEEAKGRLELLGERVRSEMIRFRREKALELRDLLFSLVRVQVHHSLPPSTVFCRFACLLSFASEEFGNRLPLTCA